MSFADSLKKNLKPELYTQVIDSLGDDFDLDLVPRTRLNKVIGERNTLRAQIAGGDNTPPAGGTEPPAGGAGSEPPATQPQPPVDVEALKKQWEKEQGDAVTAVKLQFATLDKLRGANAIDAELIWNAGLIDTSKLTLDATGAVQGVDALITQLQKDKAHLFGQAQGGAPNGTGKDGGAGDFSGVTDKASFLKLDADKQIAFKQANPTMFAQISKE